MRVSFSLAIVLPLVLAVAPVLAAEHTTDSPEVVKKALANKKAVLVDVREMTEWAQGRLQDAKLLPLSLLMAGAKPEVVATAAPKGTVIYLHCKSGGRCLQAADILSKLGYDVRPLKQGYQDLLDAGFAPAPR